MAQQKESLQHAALSDIGMRRANNQDSFTVKLARNNETWHSRGHLFIVADGMGAHAAGELASKMAVDGITHSYLRNSDLSAPEALKKTVEDTNAEIHQRGEANVEFHNMGTTCSTLALVPQGAIVAHVGDSRVYRLRGDCLEQLTFDHSLIWELEASGQFPEGSDLSAVAPKNVITRSLGPRATVQVDMEGPFPIELGDAFLLCSDGLTGKVEDDELGPLMASLPPDEAVQVMVDLANLRGGNDNITVIIVKVTGQELTSNVAGREPIRLGAGGKAKTVHPILWVIMAACFLGAVGIAALGSWLAAALALAGGIILLAVIFYQQQSQQDQGVQLAPEHRFGKGPHRRAECPAGESFVEKLADIIARLREMAGSEKWNFDLQTFDTLCQQATEAAAGGKHSEAVKQYSRAISELMQQVRNQNNKNAADSSVDLV